MNNNEDICSELQDYDDDYSSEEVYDCDDYDDCDEYDAREDKEEFFNEKQRIVNKLAIANYHMLKNNNNKYMISLMANLINEENAIDSGVTFASALSDIREFSDFLRELRPQIIIQMDKIEFNDGPKNRSQKINALLSCANFIRETDDESKLNKAARCYNLFSHVNENETNKKLLSHILSSEFFCYKIFLTYASEQPDTKYGLTSAKCKSIVEFIKENNKTTVFFNGIFKKDENVYEYLSLANSDKEMRKFCIDRLVTNASKCLNLIINNEYNMYCLNYEEKCQIISKAVSTSYGLKQFLNKNKLISSFELMIVVEAVTKNMSLNIKYDDSLILTLKIIFDDSSCFNYDNYDKINKEFNSMIVMHKLIK